MDFEELLIIVDPGVEEQPVLERAAALARQTGAELELFVCDYDTALSGDIFFDSRRLSESRRAFIERHRQALERSGAALRAAGHTVAVDVAWDAPLYEGIVRKVTRARPNCVLKDTHCHSVLQRTLLSNTDWQLIRSCPAPLWLVKPQTAGLQRVVAAVDPGHVGDKAAGVDQLIVETAIDLAARLGAELHVVHVFQPLPSVVPIVAMAAVPLAADIDSTDYDRSLEDAHRERVAQLLSGHDVPAERIHIRAGRAAGLIPEIAAELDAGLVVMGAVSRSRLHDVFIGHTAERVLESLPCDVLIVKPRGFRTTVKGKKPRQ